MTVDDTRCKILSAARAKTAVLAAGAIVVSLALSFGTALAQDKTYTMKITLPTLNDPSHMFAKNYAAALERDSGNRLSVH